LPWLVPLIAFYFTCVGVFLSGHIMRLCQTIAKEGPTQERYQELWLGLCCIFVPAAFATYPRSWRKGALAGAAGLVLVSVLQFLPMQFRWLAVLAPIAGLAWLSYRAFQGDHRSAALNVTLLTLCLMLATYVRCLFMAVYLPKELDPDSINYLRIAKDDWGWATEFREPGFIWVIQLMRALFLGTYENPYARMYGLFLSYFTIAAVFEVARRLFGLVPAVVTAAFMAVTHEFSFDAVRLLRDDLIVASFFIFAFYYIRTWARSPHWKTYLVLALIAAAGILLRLTSLYFMLFTIAVHYAWAAFRNKTPLRQSWILAIGLFATVAPIAPYLVYSKYKFNNPMYAVDIHNRFYANTEFKGDPRFPSAKQLEADSYTGGPMKMTEYFFKYHSISTLVDGTLDGIRKLYFGWRARYAFQMPFMERSWIFTWVWWNYLGLIAYMIWRNSRLMFALVFLFHAPSLYLVHFIWFDPRLHTTAFAAHYLGCGLALVALWQGGQHLMQMVSPPGTRKHEVKSRESSGGAKRRTAKPRAAR
jgi:hypothetical protein